MNSASAVAHPWLPRSSCDPDCLRTGAADASRRLTVVLRVTRRVILVLLLALLLTAALPLLVLPLPGRTRLQRGYCRLVLWSFGVRITVSGGPIRNLRGVLVVSDHMSWLDAVAIGTVLPGAFVARADMFTGPAIGIVARMLKIIPIERASLRRLPGVVDIVAARLSAGDTVVAFPEGTTWCGFACGPFYPAMFQAAIDAGRPVQPLRLSYHHRDGTVSTVPAYIGDDTLLASIRRLAGARRTLARIHVASLQLPGNDRRELSRRCQSAVRVTASPYSNSPGGARTRAGEPRPAGLGPIAQLLLGPLRGPHRRRAPVSWPRHGVPGSCRHHPDASRSGRGDDGRAEHGR